MKYLKRILTASLMVFLLNSTQLWSTGMYSIPKDVLPIVYKNLDLKGLFELRTVNLGANAGERGRVAAGEDNVAKFLNNPDGYGPFLLAGTFMQRIKEEYKGFDLEGDSGYFIWFSDQVAHGDRTIQKEWLSDDVKSTDALMGRFDIIYTILTATDAERAEMIKNRVDELKLNSEELKDKEREKYEDFHRWVLTKFSLKDFPSLKLRNWFEVEGKFHAQTPLMGKQIRYLSPAISQMTSLLQLNLAAQGLQLLPTSIGKLNRLYALSLSGLSIRIFPKSMEQLQELERLDLTSMGLEVVPGFIKSLSKIKTIMIDNLGGPNYDRNNISSIPRFIADLPNLQKFLIHGNPLDADSIAFLKNLRDKRKEEGKVLEFYDSYVSQEDRLIKD